MIMRPIDKRTLFRICLEAAGITLRDWAAGAGVSEQFVGMLLNDQRTSKRVEMLMTQFIRKHLPLVRCGIDEAELEFGLAA